MTEQAIIKFLISSNICSVIDSEMILLTKPL